MYFVMFFRFHFLREKYQPHEISNVSGLQRLTLPEQQLQVGFPTMETSSFHRLNMSTMLDPETSGVSGSAGAAHEQSTIGVFVSNSTVTVRIFAIIFSGSFLQLWE